MTKTCVSCKWSRWDIISRILRAAETMECAHPASTYEVKDKTNMITGKVTKGFTYREYCSFIRQGACGQEGKLWEPR